MRENQLSPYEQVQIWRVILSAIGLSLFLGTLLSALYIVDSLFN